VLSFEEGCHREGNLSCFSLSPFHSRFTLYSFASHLSHISISRSLVVATIALLIVSLGSSSEIYVSSEFGRINRVLSQQRRGSIPSEY